MKTAIGAALILISSGVQAELQEVNVALGKATFGDVSFGAPTSRGNDGVDGIAAAGNWTHADYPTSATPYPGEVDVAPNPYWQVDLGEAFDLTRIELVDRVGCCDPNRLNGSTISLLDETGTVIGEPVLVEGFLPASTVDNATKSYDNEGAGWAGVFAIRIDGLSTNQYFQFSEFRAFSIQDVLPNMALGAPAQFYDATGTAVPSWNTLPASHVTDGIGGTVTHPLAQLSPDFYVEVDLGEVVQVGTVAVTGRQDGCCPERLEDALLELLDGEGEVVFSQVMAGQVTVTQAFEVPGSVNAQFARITNANGADYGPQVAEIEIFAPAGDQSIVVEVDSVDPTTGDVTLFFTSVEGGRYAVYSSATLEEGTWAGIIDNIESQGDRTTISFNDVLAVGAPRRFYRVDRE
ncbi:MAG: hypothetical protein ACON38_01365 [Akkermansiaceae bacterium]